MTDDHAIIALGSNLGDRLLTLQTAVERLSTIGAVVAVSQAYETPPLGPPQPAYLNAVALVRSSREPADLLEGLHAIERGLGRERREKWGPRTLDLDLVSYGGRISAVAPSLPHPGAHTRAFVLVPLVEVAPDAMLPGRGVARDLLADLPPSDVAAVRPFARLRVP